LSKKIAIVANSTWNIYNFRLNLIKVLLDEGWQVIVIAPLDEYIQYKEKFPKVKHVQLRHLHRISKNPFKELRLVLELRIIYKKLKPDLILHYTHKPNIFGGIAAKLNNIKSIAVITGLGYAFINNGISKSITTFLYRLVCPFHAKVIFENDDDLEYFKSCKLINKEQGVAVNGCGVDSAVYVPYPNGQVKQKMIFTFIGRLLYDKGIREFAEAAKIILKSYNNAEFWVVGELDSSNPSTVKKKELLEWIDDKTIVYHGFQEDIRPLVAMSDCIVLPSYREGMPRTLLEGMSMAKPIITTNTPGCRQTINEGVNGFLVNVKDVDDLVRAIEKLITLGHDKAHDMGEAGRKMVLEKFNSEKIAKELFDIVSLA